MLARPLGFRYLDAKDYPQAETAFRTALASAPTNTSLLNGLAIALYRQGSLLEALSHARQATVLKPRHAAYLHNLATICRDCGQWNEGEIAIRVALETTPKDARLHAILGQILTLDGKLAEAEPAFREAMMLDLDSARYREQLADLLLATNQPREAEVQYRRAVALSPRNDRFRRKHQELLETFDEELSAVQSFSQAVERHPDDPLTLLDLADFYLSENQPNRAQPLCERVLELAPSFWEAHHLMKKCHLMNGLGEDGSACRKCLDGGHEYWGGPEFDIYFCCGCGEGLEGNELSIEYCCGHRYVGGRHYEYEEQAEFYSCMDCNQPRSMCTCYDSEEGDEDFEETEGDVSDHQEVFFDEIVYSPCEDCGSYWGVCVCFIDEIDPDEPAWEDEDEDENNYEDI